MATYLLEDWRLGLVGFLTISGVLVSGGNPCLAQITPDTTLGTESSVVTPSADIGGIPAERIDGGATRGMNLFHSFEQFNVGEGQRVYFANPAGIENILTRVTGTNASQILGTLGVSDGSANLFVINPNGIIFGSNARLDIRGSFFASTASSFNFPDGTSFSATHPTAPPLLTVNVTPGLQWGTSQPGATITNTGNLAVGQNLTLVADKLDLQGQLQAGGDLTLLAQDTVKVRDSVTTPFLALAGGILTLQGNGGIDILTLNHPAQTPFVSGGNLSLISDGIISLDAHFTSGGNFSIKSVSGGLANLVSYYDPIISSTGDVDVAANYTGTSLLVEAQGNIRFGGDINITGPDTNTLPDGPDTATLSSSSALIMRSGQSSLAYGGVNSGAVPAYGAGGVPEGITIGGDVILQPFNGAGGIVDLLAASGGVNTRLISTNGQQIPDYENDAYGGAISIEATKGSISTGDLYSYSRSSSGSGGNGGSINLVAANDINITGDLYSYSFSYYGSGGNGGAISLVAANGINITGSLDSYWDSFFGSGGNGGAISLVAANGINITGSLRSSSFSVSNTGNGGAINLVAANGSINTGSLESYSRSDFGSGGQGGTISLFAADGSITIGQLRASWESFSGSGGQGGAISLVAANGSITTGDLYSYSFSESGNRGNGGTISLVAANGSITTGNLYSDSFSYYGSAGNGGAISLVAANGSITTGDLYSYSFSESGSGGNGGAISLVAANGSITTDELQSYSSSIFGSAGSGGNINLEATNTIELRTPTNVYDFNALTIVEPIGGSINSTGELGSGNISIVSHAPLVLDNSVISSDTFGSGRGGDIYISAPSISLTGGAQLSASTHSSGQGGNITLIASNFVELSEAVTEVPKAIFFRDQTGFAAIPPSTFLGGFIPTGEVPPLDDNGLPQFPPGTLFPSGVFTQTTQGSTGNAGNITIETGQLIIKEGAAIATTTFGENSNAGNISVQALNSISVDNGSIKSGVAGGARGDSGNIAVNTNTLSAVNGGQLLTSTAGDGQAGDIIVNAREIQLSGSNSGLFAQTSSASEAGDLTLQPLGEGQTLTVNFFDGAQISASTQGSGRGGNLMITAPKSITLSGNGSLISAETSGSGTGGDLTLYTETLTVENQAKVTVSSTETGNAGNLNVTADSVLLDNGELIAQTASGEGGNINLDISDLLSMRHNSLISAQAGNNGNGGNIDIDAQLIVAIPGENSDIVADASKGNGGNINITTSGIFGLESRNQRTPLSDITASSELGLDGEVTITQPDVDPSQGLAQLPIDLVDATRLVERSCTAGQGSTGNSSFTVTGRGGLPPNLTEAMNSDAIEVGWIPLPPGDGKRLRTAVSTNPTPSMPRRIVEAQGLVKTPDGQVVLVAQAPDATPSSPWQKSPSCQGTQAFTN